MTENDIKKLCDQAIDKFSERIGTTDEECEQIKEILNKKLISLPTIILKEMGKL